MGRVFACSDLHGMIKLYHQINNFLREDDVVYFLGDAIDRGPAGWLLFKEILNNPKWCFIKGNHESMLRDAMVEYYSDEWSSIAQQHHAANGGYDTFSGWLNDCAHKEWIGIIDHLPYHTVYTNKNEQHIILSHAGFTPSGLTSTINNRDLIWGREHISDSWPDGLEDVIVVHGHTPVPYIYKTYGVSMPADLNKMSCFWYATDQNGNNHKCCLDLGCWHTKKTVLLDLDTFETHHFVAIGGEKNEK